jgi:hypothetical protein
MPSLSPNPLFLKTRFFVVSAFLRLTTSSYVRLALWLSTFLHLFLRLCVLVGVGCVLGPAAGVEDEFLLKLVVPMMLGSEVRVHNL